MAGKKDSFKLTVIKESGVVFFGDCKILFVPGEHEIIAIMPQHTPMIMKLANGEVVVQDGHEKRKLTTIKKGLLYVGDNEVTVLVDI